MSVGEIANREERPPYVRFERRSVEDTAATIREGRYVGKDMDFALITPPYSKDCVVHKVSNWLENVRRNVRDGRTPQTWLEQWEKAYKMWSNGQEVPLHGTPIKGWGIISPSQQEMLVSINCLTVEDLADVNDEGLRRIGIGAIDLKNKAKNWLASLKDHGAVAVQMAALESENKTLKASLEGLQNQVASLRAMIPRQQERVVVDSVPEEISAAELLDDEPIHEEPVVVAKRRGRPPKKQDDLVL